MAKVWECTLKGQMYGNPVENIIWLQTSDAAIPDQDLADSIGTSWISFFQALISDDLTMNELYFNEAGVTGPGITLQPDNWPITGSKSTDALGPQVTLLVKLAAAPPGYPVRNRRFIGGLCEDQNIQGRWGTGVVASFIIAGGFFITGYLDALGNTWQGGLYSKTYETFKTASGISVTQKQHPQKRRTRS